MLKSIPGWAIWVKKIINETTEGFGRMETHTWQAITTYKSDVLILFILILSYILHFIIWLEITAKIIKQNK